MPEFLTLVPPDEARAKFFDAVNTRAQGEEIALTEAYGRVIFQNFHAPFPLPEFRKSTVDGYAVIAGDTFGAGPSLPVYLFLSGEVMMGKSFPRPVGQEQAVLIHTGGMLPEQADAVVMLEHTQLASGDQVEVLRSVAAGENVIQIGEEVEVGELVVEAGAILHEGQIGALAAFGSVKVKVASRPKVAIIATGDEVLSPGGVHQPGNIFDVNSFSISALIQKLGGLPKRYGIVKDDLNELKKIAAKAHRECDIVIVTAGSSASARDHTVDVIQTLGDPGVLVHGVNIKPGKPTILAVCKDKPVIGLPGNPLSAFVIARVFLPGLLSKMMQTKKVHFELEWSALTANIASQAGREDWVAAKIKIIDGKLMATPVYGKSNMILSLVRANALLKVPANKTGIPAGEPIEFIRL
jgi:molybdopterin molybdotransferase